ncbi:MAG: serine/threonine-protein kinase [Polyangiaceae bacterium]
MSVPFKKQLEQIPKRLGRYEVRAKIADGGMATIYLGRGSGSALRASERVVALKVIKAEYSLNRDFVNMFLDEAKIVSKLSHPNVVELYELGNEGHTPFIAMELLSGQSLWSVWEACRERNVRLRYDLVAWIGARIAQGLHHAHELRDGKGKPLNIVHRDVNASNVFITYDGQVKIIDFGLAKAANRVSRTAAGVVKGKLAYMSPEQTVGKPLDCRTDIFALGTTLWELTVDRRLFKGKDDIETLTAVHKAKIPDPTKLVDGYPPQFWAVLRQALERDRERRFRNAHELSQKLDECALMEGRHVDALAMKEVMHHLFAAERERQMAWLAEASGLDSLRSTPTSKAAPPPGTFAPATRDDIDSADILEAVYHPDLTEPFELARRKWPRGVNPRLLAGVLALLAALGFLIAAILWKP